jgi:dienelactone hydrolase
MGGRTAVAVADHRSVAGVVALAPWLTASDPVDTLRGKALAAAHGSRDRITSARETAAYVRRAEAVAASTEFCSMGRVGHYMLRTIPAWNCFAVSRSLRILEDADRRYDGACGRSGDVDQER